MPVASFIRWCSPKTIALAAVLSAAPFLASEAEACQSASNAGRANFCDNAPGSQTGFYSKHANAQECVIAAYACLGYPRQADGSIDYLQRTVVGVVYQGWDDDWCGPEANNGQVDMNEVCNGRQGLINHIAATNFSRVVNVTGMEQENQHFQDRLGDTQYYCETNGGCVAAYVPISFYAQLFDNPARLVLDEEKNFNISESDKLMLRYYLQGPWGVYAKGSGVRIGDHGYGDQMTNFVLNENHPDNQIYEILSMVSSIVDTIVERAGAFEEAAEAEEFGVKEALKFYAEKVIDQAVDYGAHLLN